MNKLRIFQITHANGEKAWVAAETNIHAIQIYCSTIQLMLNEIDKQASIEKIPENEWKDFRVLNEYDEVESTFAEWMQRWEDYGADIIAITA